MTTYYVVDQQQLGLVRSAVVPRVSVDIGLGQYTGVIAGVIYDVKGLPVPSATVKLLRDADDAEVDETTSDSTTGAYSFTRNLDDPYTYHVMAYSVVSGSIQIHGVSERGLVPS